MSHLFRTRPFSYICTVFVISAYLFVDYYPFSQFMHLSLLLYILDNLSFISTLLLALM